MKKDKKISHRQVAQTAAVAVFAGLMLLVATAQIVALGQNYYVISVNGEEIGSLSASADVEALMIKARRQVMQDAEGYAYVDAEVKADLCNEKFRKLLTSEQILSKLTTAIKDTAPYEKVPAYTITAGGYSANFASQQAAFDFLEQVKNRTEGGEEFTVALELAAGQKHARKAEIIKISEQNESQTQETASYGVTTALSTILQDALQAEKEEYQDQTGILSMNFADNVYGYENLVSEDSICDPTEQTDEVTKEKETNTIYVVEAGDCLSVIAEKFETTVDSIVALNELGSSEATVYLDQELTVAVPKPDISLRVTEGIVYEENYAADPQIIPNDAWYTTKEVLHQEGVDGQREVNAAVTYENGLEVERTNLHATVLEEAVPAVVEQGTQIPPTYIKPISGGRFTSGYGKRWGRMHKGVDWAVSVGTPVYASSAGTVSVAGAVRGYGYAVYINHPDGRQTRYGHLSKVLVSSGQTIEQGEKIALSGNTGRSTGPHLHFEILIEGSQVNPLNYMN